MTLTLEVVPVTDGDTASGVVSAEPWSAAHRCFARRV